MGALYSLGICLVCSRDRNCLSLLSVFCFVFALVHPPKVFTKGYDDSFGRVVVTMEGSRHSAVLAGCCNTQKVRHLQGGRQTSANLVHLLTLASPNDRVQFPSPRSW